MYTAQDGEGSKILNKKMYQSTKIQTIMHVANICLGSCSSYWNLYAKRKSLSQNVERKSKNKRLAEEVVRLSPIYSQLEGDFR
jgi:hypothetical protein